jgi:hypothetical protein
VDTRRRGVGVETAFESFFLWDRVPLLVRSGVTEVGIGRIGGVGGAEETGWEDAGAEGARARKASKSER